MKATKRKRRNAIPSCYSYLLCPAGGCLIKGPNELRGWFRWWWRWLPLRLLFFFHNQLTHPGMYNYTERMNAYQSQFSKKG